jgi:hypothetical protein
VTGPNDTPDSENRMPSAGPRTTGLVSARLNARTMRAVNEPAASSSRPRLISTCISASGVTRMEPAASATATGTVPVGPSTADTIGRPTPARFGKAMVTA